MGPVLLALMIGPAAVGLTQEQPAGPEDWRDLAIQSHVVATVTVTEPRIRVVRPEKKVFRTVEGADGQRVTIFPQMSAYLEGLVVRVRVDQLYKSDGHATVGGELELFFPWHAATVLDAGERLLVFLKNPIPLDALSIEKYGTVSRIYGTTLEYPGDIDGRGEAFNVASAYGITMPEIWRGARPLLSYATTSEETLALAIREAKAAADRTPPLVTLTAPAAGYVRGTVTLAGHATDDLQVGSAQITADGTPLATFAASPFTAAWDTTSLPDGAHILKATALDSAGNRGESAALQVTVDNKKPALKVMAIPGEVGAQRTRLIPVQVTVVTLRDARDPAPTLTLVSITAEGPVIAGDVAEATLGTDDRAFQLRARPNPPGQPPRVYTITYEARDAAGNTRRATTKFTVLRPGDAPE
jgi:hypothetical protein